MGIKRDEKQRAFTEQSEDTALNDNDAKEWGVALPATSLAGAIDRFQA